MSVIIKKYANRKLYDEDASAYLSMLELSELAANNSDVRVTCDRTGRDITLETLSRALYERLKAYADEDATIIRQLPFSVEHLTDLIASVPLKAILPKTAPSKMVSSKTVPSKTVPPKTVPPKMVSPKTVPLKMVSPKMVPPKGASLSKMRRAVKKGNCGRKS